MPTNLGITKINNVFVEKQTKILIELTLFIVKLLLVHGNSDILFHALF